MGNVLKLKTSFKNKTKSYLKKIARI